MILVTGASGLIGRATIRELIDHGHRTRAHYRTKRQATSDFESEGALTSQSVSAHVAPGLCSVGATIDGTSASAVVLDADPKNGTKPKSAARSADSPPPLMESHVLDFSTASVEDFVTMVRGCDTIVHTAGLVHNPRAGDDEFQLLNVKATQRLAKAAELSNVRTFVFFSTSAVYGSDFEKASEHARLRPENNYARSKMECEQFLLSQCRSFERLVILRPSLVFGEGDRGNMLALIRQIGKKRYVNVRGNSAQKSIIAAPDAAYSVRLCLERLNQGRFTFNLANPESEPVNELAEIIARCLGERPPKLVSHSLLRWAAGAAELVLGKRSPLTRDRLTKLMTSTTLDVSELVRKTSFKPRLSVNDALTAEICWARAEQLI